MTDKEKQGGAATLPGPAELRRMMRFYSDRATECDKKTGISADSPEWDRRNEAMDRAWDVYFALQKLVCFLPAKEIDDAFAVLLCAADLTDSLKNLSHPERDAAEYITVIDSALTVLVAWFYGQGAGAECDADEAEGIIARASVLRMAHGLTGGVPPTPADKTPPTVPAVRDAIAAMDSPLGSLDRAIDALWRTFEEGEKQGAVADPERQDAMYCAMHIAAPALRQLREHWDAAFKATGEPHKG